MSGRWNVASGLSATAVFTGAAKSTAATLIIKKDKTAPTINTALSSSNKTTSGFTLNLKATDTTSGTNKII